MVVIQCCICYLYQQKIPKYGLTASSAGYEYGTKVVWLELRYKSFHKISAPGSILYVTEKLR
jgi:hypothetical protein